MKPVSKLCFGSLTVGPLQADMGIERGSGVIAHALNRSINFIDTAQYYDNYPIIKKALVKSQKFDAVISSKTYAYTRELARAAVEEARSGIGRDYIDIFMLHEQESIHTLRGHMNALDYLLECRELGIIHAVGVSMHHVSAVEGVCALFGEFGREIDVIHPIYNLSGIGIADGDKVSMLTAMECAKNQYGIGIFSMKPLGGGHLYKSAADAFDFVLDTPCIDSVAVGMQSESEVDANIEYFENRRFNEKSAETLLSKIREIRIDESCEGCGRCAAKCSQNALSIHGGQAVCDFKKCVMCGYCSGVCPVFAIKVW